MTRNSPITYQDFTSIVENSDLDADDYETANENFKFTDIEVGKIYVFYSGAQVWFITPIWLRGENDYGMHWSYDLGINRIYKTVFKWRERSLVKIGRVMYGVIKDGMYWISYLISNTSIGQMTRLR